MHPGIPSPSRARKRSSAWITNDDLHAVEGTPASAEDMPSKRLLNNHGEPVQTGRIIKYNVQKLLNHLAFTRFYVTANFRSYNPSKSFVILCMVPEQNDLYHTLWFVNSSAVWSTLRTMLTISSQLLPSLYAASPTLQALAITEGYVDPNAIPDQTLLRRLPLVTTAGMMDDVVEELQAFREEVGASASCVAVIDPRGICVWNSVDDVDLTAFGSLEEVRQGIANAVGGLEAEDVEMGNG